MRFMLYLEAEVFYSVYGDYSAALFPILDVYACGKKDNNGVIATINRTTMQPINYYKATNWEFHKIATEGYTGGSTLRFVVSGRTPNCDNIGYTAFNPPSAPTVYYRWLQNTERASLCVVTDNVLENDGIILASSYDTTLTLTPVNLSSPLSMGTAYKFSWIGLPSTKYCVQDIGMFTTNDVPNPPIYVAGYIVPDGSLLQHHAWFGSVAGLTGTSIMNNINYSQSGWLYEHYKVKYYNGRVYTGGFFQGDNSLSVLFATPLVAKECGYPSDASNTQELYFPIYFPITTSAPPSEYPYISIFSGSYQMPYYERCFPFKGEDAPELIMSIENESKITTFNNRITVKDTPTNTNYQIYTITGQLIQTGATNPDISTAQLSKGLYILRLENGKALKFVK